LGIRAQEALILLVSYLCLSSTGTFENSSLLYSSLTTNPYMKIFCSGIGGIGLSAYAAFQASQGHIVSGSDRADSAVVQDLCSQGIAVSLLQDGTAIPFDAELFVYSEAVLDTSPERVRAKELKIPQQSYFQALGELSKTYRVIAVCGTHGKSSTTAMAARVLMESHLDPNVIVGTKLRELSGRNWKKGGSELFVLEACEYRRSFHFLSPKIILLTNADGDHFDYYQSQDDYEQAFVDFIQRLPSDGLVIAHGSDPVSVSIVKRGGRSMIDADAFSLPSLATPGVHMQQNGRLVLALAKELGIADAHALSALAGYSGSWRRTEVKGTTAMGATVIDDYGHHPTEIRATIAAILGKYSGRRLVVAFQPHTHDRTLRLYNDFTRSFRGVGLVIIPNICDARRDRDSGTVDLPAFIADIARESAVEVRDGHSLKETEDLLRNEILKNGDVLLTLGAGDITELAGKMMKD